MPEPRTEDETPSFQGTGLSRSSSYRPQWNLEDTQGSWNAPAAFEASNDQYGESDAPGDAATTGTRSLATLAPGDAATISVAQKAYRAKESIKWANEQGKVSPPPRSSENALPAISGCKRMPIFSIEETTSAQMGTAESTTSWNRTSTGVPRDGWMGSTTGAFAHEECVPRAGSTVGEQDERLADLRTTSLGNTPHGDLQDLVEKVHRGRCW